MPQRRKTNIVFQDYFLSGFPLATPPRFSSDAPLIDVIKEMQNQDKGAVLIVESGTVVGIFTERDLLVKVLGKEESFSSPINRFMTPKPVTLQISDTLADALKVMLDKGVRHIPIQEQRGAVTKIISIRDIIDFLAEQFPEEVLNLPPELDHLAHRMDGG